MSGIQDVKAQAMQLIERYAPTPFRGNPLPFVLLAEQKVKTGLASKTLHRIAAKIKEDSQNA